MTAKANPLIFFSFSTSGIWVKLNGMPRKILLVDNDKVLRTILSDYLAVEGYSVSTAGDGIEVLEKINEIRPDLIVLDLVMENLDGDQVIKFLKRNNDYKDLPIILLSGVVSKNLPDLNSLEADIFIPKSDPETIKMALLKNIKTLLKEGKKRSFISGEPVLSGPHEDIVLELLNRSRNLKTMLDNLSEGLFACDSFFKITFANKSLLKMFDAPPEFVLGKDLKEFLIFLNARPAVIEDVIDHKKNLEDTKTFEIFRNDKIYRLRTSYLNTANSFSGILIVCSDLTEQKVIEKKARDEYIKRTKELENTYRELQRTNVELIKANEIKAQFVANVSHELRSPLNDIMGFVQLLQAKIYGPTEPRQDEALRNIMHNSNTLLKMINEILDVTKLDKEQMPIMTNKIHPRELIEQVIGSYSWIGEAKEIEVKVFYPDNLPVIETDDTKLKRILLNLLDNSVKFTEKGHIHLKVENKPQAKEIVFLIEDTGIGISEEGLKLLFEPFGQVDGSSNKQYGGVGLGLYIVKKLVDMIDGTIAVESKLGQGTTFRVKIPYALEERK